MPAPLDAQNHAVEGQFDDAPEDVPAAPDPRAGHTYIDDLPPDEDKLLEWSSESESDDEEGQDEVAEEEDAMEEAAFQTLRAEDEDWEIAERGAFYPISPVHELCEPRCHA